MEPDASTNSAPNEKKKISVISRTTMKRAVALFFVLLIALWGLVFFTGDKKPYPQLGIDLQGGTRVILVPQGDTPSSEQLELARGTLDKRINGMGVSGAKVVVDGNTLVITVPGEDSTTAKNLGQTSQLVFRPVEQTGPPAPQTLTAATIMANRWVEIGLLTPEEANQRLDLLVQNIGMYTQDDKEIESPTVKAKNPPAPANLAETQSQQTKKMEVLRADRQSQDPISQSAVSYLLECTAEDPLAGTDDPAKPLVTCDESGVTYLLGPSPLLPNQPENGQRLTGEGIDTSENISGGLDSSQGQSTVHFKFKTGQDSAAQAWMELTQTRFQQQVAITLDSTVISAPVVQAIMKPGDATTISGSFTAEEAKNLANNLKYGALPVSFVGENGEKGGTTQIISASLGDTAMRAGILAGIIGFVLIGLWGLISYRQMGVVAIISLVFSLLTIYAVIVLLGRLIGYSLDLSGIAGLIIGLGTTADSFVIFFEKIKEEVRSGHKIRSAVPLAWDRAKSTIVTGNMVAILASVIIYFLAVGEVKGFAFTLGITTVIDIVIAFCITAPMMYGLSTKKWFVENSQNGLAGAQRARATELIMDTAMPDKTESVLNDAEEILEEDIRA